VSSPPGPFSHRTIDHVLVRDLSGRCTVGRVDGGGGMDHRAQICRIGFGRRVNPRLRLRRRGCTLTARFVPRPPHLRAIRFRMGRRTVTDRRPPYVFRQRAG